LGSMATTAKTIQDDVKNWNRFPVTPLFVSRMTFRHAASDGSRRDLPEMLGAPPWRVRKGTGREMLKNH